MELYAIIGYFGFHINKIDGFAMDLSDSFGDIFANCGELHQMLSTSKRFTDQLGDMLNLDRETAGPDTLKEMENEENEPRIARIFHDVAKGQVLESFIDYTKKFGHGEFRELSFENFFELIQSRLAQPVEKYRKEIESKCGRQFCDEIIWLLPELLIRPISRAFTLVQD